MLRTLIGAVYAAAWITFSPGCSMPSRSANLVSRFTDSRDESEQADDIRSALERHVHGLEDNEATDTRVASHTEPRSQQPAGLDAATLYLIESELRDLPPAERQRWMNYLQTVDPQTVPYVLQARQMMDQGSQDPMTQGSSGGQIQGFPGAHTAQIPRMTEQPNPGGAMSQMRLNAPEPGGTPVATYAGHPSQRNPQSAEYVFSEDDSHVYGTQTNYNQPGDLPTISPGTYERTAPAERSDGSVPIAAANVEAAVDPLAQAVGSGQDAYRLEALQRVIQLTEADIAASNPGYTEEERTDYIRRHVALRMLYFMSEQSHLSQQAIPDIDPAEQEFWTELFWSVSNYFDVATTPDPAERAALATAQLASASQHLQHLAQLELWNTSFCHKISSFGNFERYDRDEFRAGQPVLLYAELRNFQSDPTNTGHFRTQLKSHIEIRRGGIDGERIEYNSFPPTEDLCRAPRNDYFHSYKIDLPHHLTPGPHALVLTVEDMLSGKISTEVLDFVVR